MYCNYPLRLLNTIRHHPRYRAPFYGTLTLFTIYILYNALYQRSSWINQPLPKGVDFLTPEVSEKEWDERALRVKDAFLHAYHGYEKYALPHDELAPMSHTHTDNFNGWGVTLFDALDTMLIMGLDGEYKRALQHVKDVQFTMEEGKYAPFFETVIRYTGGLLAAYSISKDPILLSRADELSEKLDPVFSTQSGFPLYGVNPSNKKFIGPDNGILAEMASLQLEYTYLAKLTGKKSYYMRANTVIQALANAQLDETGGMFPIHWNLTTSQPLDIHLSVGAQADSAHEYLLKQYLLTGRTDKASLEMYIRATTQIINNLIYISPNRGLVYVTDTSSSKSGQLGEPSHAFEHLSCFLPGLLALGAHTLPLDKLETLGINLEQLAPSGHAGEGYKTLSQYNLKQLHLWAAEAIGQTCWLSYADQPTGLGPEEMSMKTRGSDGNLEAGHLWMDVIHQWKSSGGRGTPPGLRAKNPFIYTEAERIRGNGRGRDYVIKKNSYLLRPETVESMYILWRVTGDAKWRKKGWEIFSAIEAHTKTPFGYASLKSVEYLPAAKEDDMPSYFLAETLKYLYLLFNKEDLLPLDKYVFNTEAHAFPVIEWTEKEKEMFVD